MVNGTTSFDKKRILVLGDDENASYHPITQIEDVLIEILNEYDVKCTKDRKELKNLKPYDLFLSYVDCWEQKLDSQYMADLLSYVAQGGRMLVLHNGISYQENYEFACMLGARFIGHPKRRDLTITMVGDHELIQSLEPFVLFEEPYQFEFIGQNHEEWMPTILMEYEMEGIKYPAAWVHRYGAGQVCYFMPGHDVSVFENIEFQKVLKQLVSGTMKK